MKKSLVAFVLLSVFALSGLLLPPPVEAQDETLTAHERVLAEVAAEDIIARNDCPCGGERVMYQEFYRDNPVYGTRDCPHQDPDPSHHVKANMTYFTRNLQTLCTDCDYSQTINLLRELRWYCTEQKYPWDPVFLGYVFLDWPAEMPAE